MKKYVVLVFCFLCAPHSADAVTQHMNKTVAVIQVSVSDCIYFRLQGVAEADPVKPNDPWFAISSTQANSKEMYAILLSVRQSGMPIGRVVTNGQTVCGYPQVLTIDL